VTDYITVADVDATLPAGWEGDGDKYQAVMQANAWLSARGVIAGDPVEAAIVKAGSLLAKEAANGRLYADTDGNIKRERAKADTVEVETEYQDGSRARSGVIALVMDLLKPYLPGGGGSTFAVRRA
jgi:hypothetical protein